LVQLVDLFVSHKAGKLRVVNRPTHVRFVAPTQIPPKGVIENPPYGHRPGLLGESIEEAKYERCFGQALVADDKVFAILPEKAERCVNAQ
jgi:hypothetical protein